MNNPKDVIKHPGVVVKKENGKIFVNILARSACSSCDAKSICSVSEVEEKTIEVYHDPRKVYEVGDKVDVVMQKTLAPKAVFLGYILPFLLVLLSLILMVSFTANEGLSALVSLGLLLPYYLVIYFLREKLNKTFMFSLE